MRQRNEAELVKRYFPYLFDEYGFAMIDERYFDHFSNWVVVLVSGTRKCRMRVMEDRGTVMIAVGPIWDPPGWESGPWTDITTLLEYLHQGVFDITYNQMGPAEPQLTRLSVILHLYMDQICAICNSAVFSEHADKLQQLWEKQWGRYLPGRKEKL